MEFVNHSERVKHKRYSTRSDIGVCGGARRDCAQSYSSPTCGGTLVANRLRSPRSEARW